MLHRLVDRGKWEFAVSGQLGISAVPNKTIEGNVPNLTKVRRIPPVPSLRWIPAHVCPLLLSSARGRPTSLRRKSESSTACLPGITVASDHDGSLLAVVTAAGLSAVEFGETEIILQGTPTSLLNCVVSLLNCGTFFVQDFPHECTSKLHADLQRIFEWGIGGVPRRISYDYGKN